GRTRGCRWTSRTRSDRAAAPRRALLACGRDSAGTDAAAVVNPTEGIAVLGHGGVERERAAGGARCQDQMSSAAVEAPRRGGGTVAGRGHVRPGLGYREIAGTAPVGGVVPIHGPAAREVDTRGRAPGLAGEHVGGEGLHHGFDGARIARRGAAALGVGLGKGCRKTAAALREVCRPAFLCHLGIDRELAGRLLTSRLDLLEGTHLRRGWRRMNRSRAYLEHR